jgi:hypothetical protein
MLIEWRRQAEGARIDVGTVPLAALGSAIGRAEWMLRAAGSGLRFFRASAFKFLKAASCINCPRRLI